MLTRKSPPGAGAETATISFLSSNMLRIDVADAPIVMDYSYRGVKAGYDPNLLRQLEHVSLLSREDIEMIISARTLERRLSQREMLKLEESDGIARLVRVMGRAIRVFEDEDLAEEWLRSPNPALDDEIPMQMARTDIGAREVEGVLTRIEHGVFD